LGEKDASTYEYSRASPFKVGNQSTTNTKFCASTLLTLYPNYRGSLQKHVY